MTELKGIDVFGGNRKADGSKTTPITINWKRVKESGIEFAILRITELYGTDQQFKRNANRCEARKIPYGVYRYSYALTVEAAKQEAREVVKLLKGRKPSLPVFYDLEWKPQREQLSRAEIEELTLAFFDVITKAGYAVGVYCNVDWYRNVLTDALKQYPLWIASYPDDDHGQIEERLRPNYPNVVCWQYSSHGTVPGINRNTDMNIWYEEEPDRDPDEGEEEPDDEPEETKPAGVTAQDAIGVARGWLGLSLPAQTHRVIIDLYNSYRPRARGYAVSYYDDYCDTTLSAIFIKLNAVDLIGGTECGVEEHVKLFKAKGIWEEDGTKEPRPGWVIVYSWKSDKQPNDTWGDHIGIVESVSNGRITTIEGNTQGGIVARNVIPVGDGHIRGYAIPQYAEGKGQAAPDLDPEKAAADTGNSLATNGVPSKARRFVGKVTTASLAVRTWAGAEYDTIKSYPLLARDDLIDVCDEIDGWYYCLVAGKYYGFVSKSGVQKV